MSPYSPPIAAEGVAFRMQHSIREYESGARKIADKALAKVAAAAGGKCELASVFDDDPWRAIIKAADSKKCDLIVRASHGRRGLAALLLGSETQKVLTHSKTPVLVCR
jgi:nucleotide-binding universal stress UspA family protein